MTVATDSPKSKIIQLLQFQFGTPPSTSAEATLIALCRDGTIWSGCFRYEAGRPPAMLWQRMIDPEIKNEGVE